MCLIVFSTLSAQDQKIADSLARIYQRNTHYDTAKLEMLRNLSFNEMRDLRKGLHYAEELIRLARQAGDDSYVGVGYFLKGTKYRLLGNLDQALADYFKSAEIARKLENVSGEGNAYGAIADIYSVANNSANAKFYYDKAIVILRQNKDSLGLASAMINNADELRKIKEYDTALLLLKEAKVIFDRFKELSGIGYTLGNFGMVYASMGQHSLAEKNINDAIVILEKAQDYYPICDYLVSMADVYQHRGDEETALNYALKSLDLAQQYALKEQIVNAHLKLSHLYEQAGKPADALQHYKSHITLRDTINNLNTVQRMADLRTNYLLSQKQIEVNSLNREKRNQKTTVISLFVTLGLTIVLLCTLYWYYKSISKEKMRSESLLLNILPAETAKELKLNGKVEAVKFNQVTVLFTDFVDFSKLAEHIEPEQLVKSIDFYFKEFDTITTKYGLEKIKTIGDSYMCACGLPTVNPAHARNVVNAAREMMELVKSRLYVEDGMSHFDIRMGIHTGPVVAGIVGIKKWQYDIWGDTVNIASRMESMSKPGRINLSETTWHQIEKEYACEYRGEIEVKNRGLLKMYFLS